MDSLYLTDSSLAEEISCPRCKSTSYTFYHNKITRITKISLSINQLYIYLDKDLHVRIKMSISKF